MRDDIVLDVDRSRRALERGSRREERSLSAMERTFVVRSALLLRRCRSSSRGERSWARTSRIFSARGRAFPPVIAMTASRARSLAEDLAACGDAPGSSGARSASLRVERSSRAAILEPRAKPVFRVVNLEVLAGSSRLPRQGAFGSRTGSLSFAQDGLHSGRGGLQAAKPSRPSSSESSPPRRVRPAPRGARWAARGNRSPRRKDPLGGERFEALRGRVEDLAGRPAGPAGAGSSSLLARPESPEKREGEQGRKEKRRGGVEESWRRKRPLRQQPGSCRSERRMVWPSTRSCRSWPTLNRLEGWLSDRHRGWHDRRDDVDGGDSERSSGECECAARRNE